MSMNVASLRKDIIDDVHGHFTEILSSPLHSFEKDSHNALG